MGWLEALRGSGEKQRREEAGAKNASPVPAPHAPHCICSPTFNLLFFFLEKSYIAAKVLRQYCKVRRETNSWIPLSRERYGCFALFDPSRNAGPPESLMAQMSPAQCHWMTT